MNVWILLCITLALCCLILLWQSIAADQKIECLESEARRLKAKIRVLEKNWNDR